MRSTESRNPNTTHIDRATTEEMLLMIQAENYRAVDAVGKALPSIATAIDRIVEGMEQGGRLIYMGAGTSGRLGVIDATECPPTFGVESDLITGLIAGGRECMFRAAEGEEDCGPRGVADLRAKCIRPADRIVGISAAGDAAYVAEALAYARSVGCVTIGITSNPDTRLALESDIAIVTETGPEVITGSTRMKAGTAQKLVLNMLSTCTMIRMGHVCENLMINLRPTNQKLRRRVISIVMELCGYNEESAIAELETHDWVIRSVVNSQADRHDMKGGSAHEEL